MNNGRHVVVESPDGNMSIGTNTDIESPPIVEPELRRDPHMQVYVKYHEVNRITCWVFLWIGLYALVSRFSVMDILNIMFLGATLYTVISEDIKARPFLAMHCMYCFITVPVAVVYNAWWDVGYLFALGLHLQLTIYWSKAEIREIR